MPPMTVGTNATGSSSSRWSSRSWGNSRRARDRHAGRADGRSATGPSWTCLFGLFLRCPIVREVCQEKASDFDRGRILERGEKRRKPPITNTDHPQAQPQESGLCTRTLWAGRDAAWRCRANVLTKIRRTERKPHLTNANERERARKKVECLKQI